MAIGPVGGTLGQLESYLAPKHAYFGAPLIIPLVWLRIGKWNYIFSESPESSEKSTFSTTWNLHFLDMKLFWVCSPFHVGSYNFMSPKCMFMSGFVHSRLMTWKCTFRHEITLSDMNQLSATWMTFLRSDSGPAFFNFFLTFMSGWCNFTLFFIN